MWCCGEQENVAKIVPIDQEPSKGLPVIFRNSHSRGSFKKSPEESYTIATSIISQHTFSSDEWYRIHDESILYYCPILHDEDGRAIPYETRRTRRRHKKY